MEEEEKEERSEKRRRREGKEKEKARGKKKKGRGENKQTNLTGKRKKWQEECSRIQKTKHRIIKGNDRTLIGP